MGMAVPENSIPMVGAKGQYDYITMGGMFTILKVRENLKSYEDPGWYKSPPGTLADTASEADINRDGIDTRRRGPAPTPAPAHTGHGGASLPPSKP